MPLSASSLSSSSPFSFGWGHFKRFIALLIYDAVWHPVTDLVWEFGFRKTPRKTARLWRQLDKVALEHQVMQGPIKCFPVIFYGDLCCRYKILDVFFEHNVKWFLLPPELDPFRAITLCKSITATRLNHFIYVHVKTATWKYAAWPVKASSSTLALWDPQSEMFLSCATKQMSEKIEARPTVQYKKNPNFPQNSYLAPCIKGYKLELIDFFTICIEFTNV